VVWIVGLVALQRLGELVLSNRNTSRLLARGGREVGAGHYPLMVLLHASWLVAIVVFTPLDASPNWWLIAMFVVLQLLRVWVIATLGPYWTTRVITNYWVVAAEIAVLPLAFGQWPIALVWSVLNALLLRHRIALESAALEPRRAQ
jgi:methyltransferase